MKYGDFLLILLGIIFILSIGYSIGVDNRFWFITPVFLAAFIYLYYQIKIR